MVQSRAKRINLKRELKAAREDSEIQIQYDPDEYME